MADPKIPTRSIRKRAAVYSDSPACLVCIHAPLREAKVRSGSVYELAEAVTEIGRATGAIPLSDNQVSGRHCRIERLENGAYLLRDLQSTNGTFVEGVRIESELLSHKSTITLAEEYRFMFWRGEKTDPALADHLKELGLTAV